uniref:Uncharacterized protein n=1 Tax=Siphoviridae sp. ctUi914 TaxID=2825529 RepID=A0A8S5TXE9_9CAUD|nr:MAG TPA: hypothetical protein [Siphoviridae sp. ctUi914]
MYDFPQSEHYIKGVFPYSLDYSLIVCYILRE